MAEAAVAAPVTSATQTTTETTIPPGGGSGTETNQGITKTSDNVSALAAGLGDGTGGGKQDPSKDNAAGETASKVEAKPSSAPEKYEAWKVPEGYDLDTGLVEEVSPIFKKFGLTQEQSQELVDFYAKHSIKSAEDSAAANNKAFWDLRRDWREGLKADEMTSKLVGKDGNFGPDSPLISTINEAMNGLQNPKLVADFKAAMDLTGAGDNPAFVKVLYSLAKQVTEGSSYANGAPVVRKDMPKSAAAAIFPHLPSASG